VHLADSSLGRAAVPSGASTGEHEAVANINEKIAPAIHGREAED
jgi:enolase